MEEKKEEVKDEKKKGLIGSLICLIKKCIVIFIPGIIIALILFVIINAALVPTSKPKFCGELCHKEMGDAYTSWQKSPHAVNRTGIVVKCIDCHLPPKDKYFTHLAAKAQTGIKDAALHIVGAEYDAKAIRAKVTEHMTNAVCERCHANMGSNTFDEDIAGLHNDAVYHPEEGEEPGKCIDCHEGVGHEREE
jgi:cytochrome c nitrite reductase small subunit